MLTVAKITQRTAADYAEYLEGKAHASELGDYYLKDGERVEAPGRWAAGAAAAGCDPDAVVADGQLRALLAARRPDTGGELRRAGGTGEAVAALDATLSAPKSVSAAWAVADMGLRERIERAHEVAIDRALEYSQRHVAMVRERIDAGTVIHSKPSGLVATSWRHTTARAVDGRAPDPQLHSHVLLHAAVRRDGRMVAIDSRSWLVHQREVGAAYRTELARGLHQLGFDIRRGTGRGGRYFEVVGIPQGLVDQWSSRHHEVQAAIRARFTEQEAALEAIIADRGPDAPTAEKRLRLLRRYGQLAPAEERFMSATTRTAKARRTSRELDEHWRNAAARHRLDRAAFGRLRAARPQLRPATPKELLEELTEFDATFHAREARAVALERSAGLPITPALEALRDLRSTGDIVVLVDGTGTTRQHRHLESATVALATRLAATAVAALAPKLVAGECQWLDRELPERGGRLSEEQRRAIELGCGTRALVVIEGQAGTGKSTTLIGIARAHQACGREVVVTSTAAVAAERLALELQAAGVKTTGYSTAALTRSVASGRLEVGPWTTVIHDEAALAATREQHDLLMLVYESGARMIEVGDPRQNQPVGASGLWRHFEEASRGAGARVQLTRNQRALDPADRRDQARFRAGDCELAIRGYAARNRIHITTNQDRAEDAALTAADHNRCAGKTTLVIAQTSNQHLDELNARAQAIRIQHADLGPDSIAVPGRPYRLHTGDHVQIRRTIHHPVAGQLRNGTTAQVDSINPDARTILLKTQNGRQIVLAEEQAARADLRLAYIQHPFPAQGQTTDTTHIIIAEHATREGSYVALTRARHQTHIYTGQPNVSGDDQDQLQALADQLSRTEPDLPSIDTPLSHEHQIAIAADPHSGLEQTEALHKLSRAARKIGLEQPEPDSDQQQTEHTTRLVHSSGPVTQIYAEPPRISADTEGQPDRRWPSCSASVVQVNDELVYDEPHRQRSHAWDQ
jgi:conjugative relaxase-like TrwC/TraI family protein